MIIGTGFPEMTVKWRKKERKEEGNEWESDGKERRKEERNEKQRKTLKHSNFLGKDTQAITEFVSFKNSSP